MLKAKLKQHIILLMDVQAVIYRDEPKFDSGVKPIYIGFPIFFLILAAIGFLLEPEPTLPIVLLAIAIFLALLFWWTLPKEYHILEDRMRIVFGLGFKKDTLFSDIDSIGLLNKFGFSGFRRPKQTTIYPFRNVIAMKRRKGYFAYVSPKNIAVFYEQLANQIKVRNTDIKLLGL